MPAYVEAASETVSGCFALRKIPAALFFRPRQQLVLRLKSPAAVGLLAVEGQVEFQAVWQKLPDHRRSCALSDKPHFRPKT